EVAPGDIVLLENCRFNKGEKANDSKLSSKIASLCDVYVNDAFGAAHRTQATTHGAARYAPIACAGPLLQSELQTLAGWVEQPRRPMVAIVGGAKVSTKLTVLRTLANQVDQLIVGGGIANTFMLASGLPIGKSLAEPARLEEAREVMQMMQQRGAAIPIPVDVVCAPRLSEDAPATVRLVSDVQEDDMILDIGPRTADNLARILKQAGTIVWNGPVGEFEYPAFAGGTERISQVIAAYNRFSLAGGGDTVTDISRYNIADKVKYMTSGSGAFLEFIEGKVLPAVEVLQHRANN